MERMLQNERYFKKRNYIMHGSNVIFWNSSMWIEQQ